MKKNKRKYKKMYRNRSINIKVINYKMALIVIIMFIIGGAFIKLGTTIGKNVTPLYLYKVEKSNNYEVLLKPNNFYTTKTLPSGRYYASQSIDSFIMNFKYNLKSNKKSDLNYHYTITAELIGKAVSNNEEEKEIWDRTFNIIENKEFTQENVDELLINEKFDINYETYLNLAQNYERTYDITLDTTLRVRLNVYFDVPNLETVEDHIELDIPINDTITEVKENYEKISEKSIFQQGKTINIKEIIFYIIGAFLIFGAITITIKIINKIRKERTPKDLYENNINRILKYYRELIVTVKNEPNLIDLEIMKVSIIEDLIDVAEQNKRNIIHYKIPGEEKSNLYVIVDKIVYIYVVTSHELK